MSLRCLSLVILCFLCSLGLAHADADDLENLSDEPKTYMRALVDRADELLGGTRTDDNRTHSTLRLTGSDQESRFERSDPEFNVRFTLKLGVLQRWQKALQKWFHREVKDVENDIYSSPDKTPSTGSKYKAYATQNETRAEKDPWRFSLEKHFTLALHPGFWLHARVRKDLETGSLVNSFSTEVGWSLANKWESLATLVSSTQLASRWIFSFANQIQWRISDRVFSTSHGPNLSYIPGSNQVATLGCGIGTSVVDRKTWFADSYSINAGYRIEAWKDWIYSSVNPFLNFARSQRFRGDSGVNVSMELVF